MVKNSPAKTKERDPEDPLEEMATHFNILDWKIPWTEEPDRLQSTGSKEWDTTE